MGTVDTRGAAQQSPRLEHSELPPSLLPAASTIASRGPAGLGVSGVEPVDTGRAALPSGSVSHDLVSGQGPNAGHRPAPLRLSYSLAQSHYEVEQFISQTWRTSERNAVQHDARKLRHDFLPDCGGTKVLDESKSPKILMWLQDAADGTRLGFAGATIERGRREWVVRLERFYVDPDCRSAGISPDGRPSRALLRQLLIEAASKHQCTKMELGCAISQSKMHTRFIESLNCFTQYEGSKWSGTVDIHDKLLPQLGGNLSLPFAMAAPGAAADLGDLSSLPPGPSDSREGGHGQNEGDGCSNLCSDDHLLEVDDPDQVNHLLEDDDPDQVLLVDNNNMSEEECHGENEGCHSESGGVHDGIGEGCDDEGRGGVDGYQDGGEGGGGLPVEEGERAAADAEKTAAAAAAAAAAADAAAAARAAATRQILQAGNFFEVLGVTRFATAAEIKKAYKGLSMLVHPDKNGGDMQASRYISA